MKIPILMYHQIEEAPPRGEPFRSLYVAPRAFARQMALLRMLGYRGLSMGELRPYLCGERRGRVVGLTFDDGYVNNLTHALPVLQRHGFSATCYIVTQRAGQTNLWDREQGIAQTGLMDGPQIRQWVAGGQEVGAHTRHHVRLPQTAPEDSRDEILLSKAELEALAGRGVEHFCYPYGDYGPAHVEMVRQAGYLTATTVRRGRASPAHDLLQLPRVPVVRSTTLAQLWLKLASAYEDRRP